VCVSVRESVCVCCFSFLHEWVGFYVCVCVCRCDVHIDVSVCVCVLERERKNSCVSGGGENVLPCFVR